MTKYELEGALLAMQRKHDNNSSSWWLLEGVIQGLNLPMSIDGVTLERFKQQADALER